MTCIQKGKPAYGYEVVNDCGDYSVQKDFKPDKNNTKHVLEQSTVRSLVQTFLATLPENSCVILFKMIFDTVKTHCELKDGFEHFDPEFKKKFDPCTYWRVSRYRDTSVTWTYCLFYHIVRYLGIGCPNKICQILQPGLGVHPLL
jgi:hypothetical protein